MKSRATPKTIDEYIAGFPDNVQKLLEKVRQTIRKAAPDATETISYSIPAFTLHGQLIFFAAFRRHIGLYPAPRGVAEFKQELVAYKGGKGTVQFPFNEPIPLRLVSRIVKYRVKANLARAAAKRKKR